MIRVATHEDIGFILSLALEFNHKHYDVPLDIERTTRSIEQLMEQGVIFLSERGLIAGAPVTDGFRDWTALVEFAWYATDNQGYRLLRAFIDYGQRIGADEVRMTTLNTTPVGAETLLSRTGFTPIETSHRLLV